MKAGIPANMRWRSFLSIIIVLASLSISAYGETSDITLFVQQTPDGGGETNPVSGIYHFAPNSEVTLTATPSQGYQFVYWLGDVSNPETNSTVVHLNKPKIVVAVFEQSDSSFSGGGSAGGGSGLTMTGGNISMGGGLSSTTGAKPKAVVYSPSGDSAPEVPEPATGILLALGSMLLLKNRRSNKIRSYRN